MQSSHTGLPCVCVGVYSKVFVAVSIYTWLWGTTIALMLLVGSLTVSLPLHCFNPFLGIV